MKACGWKDKLNSVSVSVGLKRSPTSTDLPCTTTSVETLQKNSAHLRDYGQQLFLTFFLTCREQKNRQPTKLENIGKTSSPHNMEPFQYIYIYIFMYKRTHTHTYTRAPTHMNTRIYTHRHNKGQRRRKMCKTLLVGEAKRTSEGHAKRLTSGLYCCKISQQNNHTGAC